MKLNIHLHYEGNHNFPGEEEKWGGGKQNTIPAEGNFHLRRHGN